MVPEGYVLTPEYNTMINTILKGNLPISSRINGFIFETFATADEFQDSISETSPYPLGRIEIPVLVINALDDPITNIEKVRGFAVRMPNARLFVIQDGGHFFFGYAEEGKKEIGQFLHSSVADK